jgi:hypothetical protein
MVVLYDGFERINDARAALLSVDLSDRSLAMKKPGEALTNPALRSTATH